MYRDDTLFPLFGITGFEIEKYMKKSFILFKIIELSLSTGEEHNTANILGVKLNQSTGIHKEY